MFNILVVEDDREIQKLFCTVLRKNGYNAISADNGIEALDVLDTQYIDLIISDIMMPKMDGYDLTKSLREANFKTPILMITAKDDFSDLQKGFDAGTDDYMVKPINVNEMLLRVSALLRRNQAISQRKVVVGSTTFDMDSLTVSNKTEEVILPQKEFYLVYKLITSPNHIYTRQQLMDEIWGIDSETDIRTVDVHIGRLRDRFKDNEDFEIITVRGLGYKAVKYER
jgi:DNA-binding response OmpR family regulator